MLSGKSFFIFNRYLINSFCGWLLFSCWWFCLWVIAYYFVNDSELAILFFPFALRLGIALHTPKRYWMTIYGAEWKLTICLALLMGQPQWLTVLTASIASFPLVWFACHYYCGSQSQWQRFAVMAAVILVASIINVLAISNHNSALSIAFLVSLTGGVMLVPLCYLVWHYLFQNIWLPLTANLVSHQIQFHLKHVVLYILLFVLNIFLQVNLPNELRYFAPFCLVIPIILLAFRYGWQGAVVGTLLNSIALIAARSGVSNMEITDLLLSLLVQTVTGIMLGVAVQRQRDLNAQLKRQLHCNHSLSRQLVKAEESVRREIARELHDEIGQNITAIRTQANIIQRVEVAPISANCAKTIESLSLNIYDTTKGLLSRLRPKILDDLGLKEAIEQLLRDMKFESHGISVEIHWTTDSVMAIEQLSDTTKITLYRLCQEALNNAMKYSQADRIELHFSVKDMIHLLIQDNGIGCKAEDHMKGFGLRGMRERVQALGGKFSIHGEKRQGDSTSSGTDLSIILPKF
ncbi:signal transduction histidine-protein kinase/phosphatase UhpB [Xenorhabdus sp. XENO-10]|uniref:Signal transduction histidine-protein kinase/phosphatase UhpB n=1 Tax=Xenorhabdus yunnanensis TaxID=3025878 RepID=A0ABT5LC55_9GAMM|nr:signal transduction histidine-protein kinase/phosphatase UhpB [Xenorhabdus yunnanensis]MDC9588667.1 signal transduction histidine-protein kinase/phosphatase UhpB [Xenorhabdus yunnanensis]